MIIIINFEIMDINIWRTRISARVCMHVVSKRIWILCLNDKLSLFFFFFHLLSLSFSRIDKVKFAFFGPYNRILHATLKRKPIYFEYQNALDRNIITNEWWLNHLANIATIRMTWYEIILESFRLKQLNKIIIFFRCVMFSLVRVI